MKILIIFALFVISGYAKNTNLKNLQHGCNYFRKAAIDEPSVLWNFNIMESKRVCKNCLNDMDIVFFNKYPKPNGKIYYSHICISCSNKKAADTRMVNAISRLKPIVSMEGEIWKEITNYEGLYSVSNYGRVKRHEVIFRWGKGECLFPERIMKQTPNREGYRLVGLTKNEKSTQYRVHRLVCEAFVPNPENKPQVNHKDGIKYSNYWDNLEWVSPLENVIHAENMGLRDNKGENGYHSKLSEKEVIAIRNSELPKARLAKIYGVFLSTIYKIKNRQTWNHLP